MQNRRAPSIAISADGQTAGDLQDMSTAAKADNRTNNGYGPVPDGNPAVRDGGRSDGQDFIPQEMLTGNQVSSSYVDGSFHTRNPMANGSGPDYQGQWLRGTVENEPDSGIKPAYEGQPAQVGNFRINRVSEVYNPNDPAKSSFPVPNGSRAPIEG
jgi:hypothetical protein